MDLYWTGRKRNFYNIDNEDSSEPAGADKKNKTDNIPVSNNNNNNSKVYSIDKDIYFYTDVNIPNSILFQKEVNKVYKVILNTVNDAKTNGYEISFPPITIHLFSPGGGIFAAFAMIDYLKQLKKRDKRVKIHTVVEGRAASAATLLSVTGDKRFITQYGYMLIHQLNSATWGKYNELKDDMENCDVLMERIKQIYKTHTKVPEADMDKILSHDLYWDADKCLAMGLVDSIIE